MELKQIIGERLKEIRLEFQISQGQIAKELGVSQAAVAQYESGRNYPSNEVLLWYANRFDVSIDYIYGLTDHPYTEKGDLKHDKDYDKMYKIAAQVFADLKKNEVKEEHVEQPNEAVKSK